MQTRKRSLLLLILAAQMLAAAAWRWPITTSDIRTQFEYQLAQVVITSENWQREGARARHFIPTRSTDHRLSEWPYYDQDYITVPPLSFMLHYGATRMFPRADAVVVAKVVAQLQIFAGVLIAAAIFYSTLGFWPPLAGFSFLIWTLPFLVWFINGYFPTTTALLVQLVVAAWVLTYVKRWAEGRDPAPRGLATPVAAAAALAALSACTEAIGLAVNGAVTIVFLGLSAASRENRRRAREWLALAAATIAGTVAMLAGIVLLYATRTEFSATFADRFSDRSGLKYGRADAIEHARVIFRQMRTAWPKWLVLSLAMAAIAAAIWCASVLISRASSRTARRQAAVGLAALWLMFVPSTIYHYVLASHVTIHWWFAGTWTVGWVVTLALTLVIARRLLFAVWRRRAALRIGYPIVCVAAALVAIVGSWPRTDLSAWSKGLAREIYPIAMYHALGDRLPRDTYPLVAVELGDLFRDYPFATAYLHRAVVLVTWDELALPWEDEPADLARLAEIGTVYVAYDPRERECRGEPVPLADWNYDQIAICRVRASDLLKLRSGVAPPRVRP